MKTKAIHLKVGQTVKFRNHQGTHVIKLSSIKRADRNELYFQGTTVSSTSFNDDPMFDCYKVGNHNYFFARYKTQFEVL